MRHSILLICLLIITFITLGQSSKFVGNWVGILKQQKGNVIENYAFWLMINIKGDSIVGYTRSEILNTPYYVVFEINGKIHNDHINFIQTRIINSRKSPNIPFWCKISGELYYDKSSESIHGNWSSNAPLCGNGSLLLCKSLKRINLNEVIVGKYLTIEELNTKCKSNDRIIGSKVVLNKISFSVDEYKLKPDSLFELNKLILFLKKYPKVNVNIQGHTDDTGDDNTNMLLSYKRAKSVYQYLIINGIYKSRITYEGFGKSRPIVDNDSESNRALNRRVEVEVSE